MRGGGQHLSNRSPQIVSPLVQKHKEKVMLVGLKLNVNTPKYYIKPAYRNNCYHEERGDIEEGIALTAGHHTKIRD